MKLQDFFAQKAVFTYQEVAAFSKAGQSRNPDTRDALLSYHRKAGRILPVRRGLYVSVPLGMDPGSLQVDPYLVAGKMAPDSVLAYHTALEFYGKAHSVYQETVYCSKFKTRPFEFRGQRYRGVVFPDALRKKKKEMFGVETIERSGVEVRVTTLDRTLVDMLDRPSLAGSWEEIWRSLESVEFFDLDQVLKYTMLLENETTAAKVGFFLETNKERLMVADRFLKKLRAHRPKKPHYLVRNGHQPTHFLAAWNLVIPQSVASREWDEIA